MPDNSNTPCVLDPIGTCHGLNSPHSPRIVTSVRNGKRKIWVSENMLMQLPTPLDCINSTPRWPPAQAPANSATPSSSVVSGTPRIVDGGQHALDQLRMAGIRHVRHLPDVEALQDRKNILRPGDGAVFRSCVSAGVHFHFRSVAKAAFRCGTVDGSRAASERAKYSISVCNQ